LYICGIIKFYENLSLENLSLENFPCINANGLVCWEEFRDIPEYKDLYQVSDLERVKCTVTSIIDKNNITRTIAIKILKLCFDSDSYLLVGISKNKKII
jgi:NUMOD4 motif